MAIWLTINPRSGVPLYVQLVEQVRHAFEVGSLQPGDPLPTVRQLASDLTIAPNTIVKAYNELQMMGLIESRPGAGTVVTANIEGTLRKQQVATLFERFHALIKDAAGLGINKMELEARVAEEINKFYGQEETR